MIDHLGPDFVDPTKQGLEDQVNSAQPTQPLLLLHRDEGLEQLADFVPEWFALMIWLLETSGTIEQLSRICQSRKQHPTLRTVIVADEAGMDRAIQMIERNRNCRQWILLNLCLWNDCWPHKLVTAITVSHISGQM